MEAYKAFSTTSRERRLYQWGTLALIGVSCAYEGYHTFALGQLSIMGWGYNLLFIILWCWRCLFQYSIQLTGDKLIVVMYGLGLERRMTAIKKYVHRYSSVDPQPQRILVYRENGKLCGLLFKSSDELMERLARRFPNQYLEFPE